MLLTLGAAATPVVGTADATAAGAASFATVCVPRPTPLPSDTTLSRVSDAVHGRLHTYTVTSPSVGLTHVNVLLPVGYSHSSPRRYPVLYLLHGALSNYADWASTAVANGVPQGGAVRSVVGQLPVIVVMPDDSPEGAYSDWYGVSAHDAGTDPVPATPSWETYDINELIPWVDSNFHTQAGAAGRAIAGLSSGGAGAAKYAVAHPGLFGFVGMFSGALDTDLVDASTNWYADANYLDGPGPPDQHCRYGDPLTADAGNQAYYWHDNDPTYEAGNLKGVKLFVASGNGTPTTADGPTNPAVRAYLGFTESVVDDMSHHFVAAVRSAGLGANVRTDFYGNGIHAWSYWRADLASFLRWLQPQLDRPLAPPPSFSFRTARAASTAWGWSFHHDSGLAVPNVNTAEEFVYLQNLSHGGFSAAGHGMVRVTTPRGSYAAGSLQRVHAGRVDLTTRANHAGQLTFSVAIGPPAPGPQLVFPAAGPPSDTPTVTVSIRGATGP
jgi:diacylglycerol O-acyltransferase / trehalose O-mycolyltransferase